MQIPVDVSVPFSGSGEAEVPSRWWKVFENPQLNDLVDQALDSNFNLQSTWYRLQAAEAVVDRESSALLPDLEATVQGEINRPQVAFEEIEQNRSLRLGLSSVYELDLWGRIRSLVQAERYFAEAAFADYQATAITVSAEITRTWFQLMTALSQLQLIEEQVETNEQMVLLLKNRFKYGLIRGTDVLRQQQLLESTLEQENYVEARIGTLENRLKVLIGQPPQEALSYSYDSLPQLPPVPETGIPVQLVQRRPDVQNAYRLLQAADQELAAAISNRYPRLSLSFSVSTAMNEADNLFVNWAHNIAGNLVAPIFYGGRLNAEMERSEAVKNQRIQEYGQTILIAFREVEDALVREQNQVESLELIASQLELLEKTFKQLRVEYFNGMTDYLEVLTALNNWQELQRDYLDEKMNLIDFRIALYRALAGGFRVESSPKNS